MTNTETGGATRARPMGWDRANKNLFSVREAVLDLVNGYVLERLKDGHEWFSRYDTDAMRLGPTENVGAGLTLSSADLRWTMPLREAPADDPGNWLELVIALEFQREIDWLMAWRVRSYVDQYYGTTWRGRRGRKTDRLPAVLPIVLYCGETEWTAPTTCEQLVDPRLVPSGLPEMPMSFTGGSYIPIDLLALSGTQLAERNVVSLMIRTLGMTDPGQAVEILGESLALPWAAGEWFFSWFGVATERTGLADIKELKDWMVMEQRAREGTFRPMVQTLLQQRDDKLRQESEKRGRIEMFRSMAEHKFGGETARRLAGILERIADQGQLDVAGNHIIDCDDSDDLIAKLDRLG